MADSARFEISTLTSVLFCLGLAVFAQGVSRFFSAPVPWPVVWLPFVLIVATIPLIEDDPNARILVRSAILMAQIAGMLVLVVRHSARSPGLGKYFVEGGLLVSTVWLLVHAGSLALLGKPFLSAVPSFSLGTPVLLSPRHLLALVSMTFATMLVAVGALMMVKDRLRFRAAEAGALVQSVFDSIPSQLCVVDVAGVITAVNEAWRRFAVENGKAPTDWVGVDYLGVCAESARARGEDYDANVAHRGIRAVLDGRAPFFNMEYPCHSPTQNRWFMMTVTPLSKPRQGAVIVHTNITERREIEALREQSVAMFDRMSRMVPGVTFKLVRLHGHRYGFLHISANVADQGLDPQALARDAQPFFDLIHPEDGEAVAESLRGSERELGLWRAQFRWLQTDGSYRWQEAQATPEREEDGQLVWYGHIADIQEHKDNEEKIRDMAQRDALTGLANRALFDDRLSVALALAERDGSKLALLFIDLDKFKPVNDTFGHEVGDLLLRAVAMRLRDNLRAADTVARVGGDEFVVLLHRIAHERDAEAVAEEMRQVLSTPYILHGHILTISVSIGHAVYPQHGTEPIELIRRADQAMYRVKQEGRLPSLASPARETRANR